MQVEEVDLRPRLYFVINKIFLELNRRFVSVL